MITWLDVNTSGVKNSLIVEFYFKLVLNILYNDFL